MSLKSELIVDGKVIEDESVEAVALLRDRLRAATETLDEARTIIARVPNAVERDWRERLRKVERELSELRHRVRLFETDFQARGLESAITDARFRKHLPEA